MDVTFHGANALRMSSKKANLVFDDNLAELGLTSITKDGDISLFTAAEHPTPKAKSQLIIDYPGEYEVSGVSIRGVAARSHMDEEGKKSAVIYRLIAEDLRICVMGHVHPDLDNEQLEAIGIIDVLFIPVGGNGYTLDGLGALKLINNIEPHLVVPTHFDDAKVKYPVPQAPLAEALKAIALESLEPVDKLKLKSADLPEANQLIVLNRQ